MRAVGEFAGDLNRHQFISPMLQGWVIQIVHAQNIYSSIPFNPCTVIVLFEKSITEFSAIPPITRR